MHYLYLLQSQKDGGFYVGYSSDLKKRILQHECGDVTSTRHRLPIELIYYEAYREETAAKKREKKLKDFGSAYTGLLKRLGLK